MQPFDFNMPAQDALFVGRRDDVNSLADALSSAQRASFGVIGGRRCGKSSLLEALWGELRRRLESAGPRELRVVSVLLSLKSMDMPSSAQDVLGRLLHEVRRVLCGTMYESPVVECGFARYTQDRPTPVAFLEFREALVRLVAEAKLRETELRIVLLIDEMDEVLGYAWTGTLFGNLRSLIYDLSRARESVRLVVAGSGRYLEADERGSQLINAVHRHYLYALADSTILELVAHARGIGQEVSDALVELVGGSPFMAQYFLYHLVKPGMHATIASVVGQVRGQFCVERSQDLEGWWLAIGGEGREVYRFLARHDDWVSTAEIQNAVARTDLGLDRLRYHGLVRHRNGYAEHRIAGILFRDWSAGRNELEFRVPDPTLSGDVEGALLEALPEKHEWERLVRYSAHQTLDTLSTGSNLTIIATHVVSHAMTHGWLADLLCEARNMNPGNQRLTRIAARLLAR